MYNRLIQLPKRPSRSFFLWGPRQVGKSTWLKKLYPDAQLIDLLKSDLYGRYSQEPWLLREEVRADSAPVLIVIDEVQKVPRLLDEVHWLIENRAAVFALSGSSARKLKRGHANLLGGRALRYELYGLVSAELGEEFVLDRLLNRGYLPEHYGCETADWPRLMLSYVGDYLKEEIAAEGLVRNLTTFGEFLKAAALSDTELINFTTFGRDVGVSANTAKEYFTIMVDTLQGWWLPAFRRRPKRRTIAASKFYFSDVGVVNHLARRGPLERGGELFGKAFENWIGHELRAFNHYYGRFQELSYWRLANGMEVDFIVGSAQLAVEAKATARVRTDHLKGLRGLAEDFPETGRRMVVCLESVRRVTEDGIEILPIDEFLTELWAGHLF